MAVLDNSVLDRLSAEAEVPRKQVADILEGFEDFLNLDIGPDAKRQLEVLRSRYTTRLNKSVNVLRKLAEAKAAINELKADGHPEEPAAIVDRQVIEQMDRNLDTLLAARSRFTPRPITTIGNITFSEQMMADF